jgi:hypothetical protein
MNIRERVLRMVLLLRGSIPTWMASSEELPPRAKALMLSAVGGLHGGSGPVVIEDDLDGLLRKDEAFQKAKGDFYLVLHDVAEELDTKSPLLMFRIEATANAMAATAIQVGFLQGCRHREKGR